MCSLARTTAHSGAGSVVPNTIVPVGPLKGAHVQHSNADITAHLHATDLSFNDFTAVCPLPPSLFNPCLHASNPIMHHVLMQEFDLSIRIAWSLEMQPLCSSLHLVLMQAWGVQQDGSPAFKGMLQRCSLGAALTCRAMSTAPLPQTPHEARGVHNSK